MAKWESRLARERAARAAPALRIAKLEAQNAEMFTLLERIASAGAHYMENGTYCDEWAALRAKIEGCHE